MMQFKDSSPSTGNKIPISSLDHLMFNSQKTHSSNETSENNPQIIPTQINNPEEVSNQLMTPEIQKNVTEQP